MIADVTVNEDNFFVKLSRQLLEKGNFPTTREEWNEALGDFAGEFNFDLFSDIKGGGRFERTVKAGDECCVYAAIQAFSSRAS
jgi:hypothetical protein